VSSTRLLVLGAVRIFQPVHGYFVRRELLSWRAEHWANVNPGSIYSALKTLTRDGFLEEVSTETTGTAPARTRYRLTGDGETEFFALLREALWRVGDGDPSRLFTAISLMWTLSRDEVIAALESRIAQLDAQRRELPFTHASLMEARDKPRHIGEMTHLTEALVNAERDWAAACLERVRDGAYVFEGEPWQTDVDGPEPPWRALTNPASQA
jgi:DNA-binding PadR family transcriptional regulator